jgi:hypothetical protein
VAISTLSACVAWNLEIVIAAFALSGRAIVFYDGCGRRLCHVCGESLQLSDPCGVCRCGLCLRLDVDSDHRHCLDSGFDAAFDLWSRLWSHHPFCEVFRLYNLRASFLDGICGSLSLAVCEARSGKRLDPQEGCRAELQKQIRVQMTKKSALQGSGGVWSSLIRVDVV